MVIEAPRRPVMARSGPRGLTALLRAASVTLGLLLCAACQSLGVHISAPAPVTSASTTEDVYVATNEPAALGKRHFERGHYGLAERYFREAVEKDPRDLDSWVGLAASYDFLKRYDLADRAYAEAFRLGGAQPYLLNNRGYSYLLRGDFVRARADFNKALVLDPSNATIVNNLTLLVRAERHVRRRHTPARLD